MRSRIPTLAAILFVQLLIAGALAMRGSALSASPPDMPFLTTPIGAADRILIEGPAVPGKPAAAPVELIERKGSWFVHSAFDVPAAKDRVSGLIKQFAALRHGLAVANTTGARRRFKVAADRYSRRIRFDRGAQTFATVYIGESAGLRKAYGRAGGERAIYTIDVASYDVPATSAGWIDTQLLQIPADEIEKIAVTGAHGPGVVLTRAMSANKAPGPWSATGLARGRALDQTKVGALVRAIDELSVDRVLGEQPSADWQVDRPEATLSIQTSDGKTTTWTLSKPTSGDYLVIKSSSQPWYFSIDSATAGPLLDATTPAGLAQAPPHVRRRAK